MPDELLYLSEVVEEYPKLTEANLRYWAFTGKGGPPFGRIGRRLVYRRSDLEKWLDARFRETTKAGP